MEEDDDEEEGNIEKLDIQGFDFFNNKNVNNNNHKLDDNLDFRWKKFDEKITLPSFDQFVKGFPSNNSN
jgi:hypothetical protein